jgi:short-subunit dehydrogenase
LVWVRRAERDLPTINKRLSTGGVLKMGKLVGKVALITGAGSGIGRAGAVLFAKEGAKVVVVDRVPKGGQETVAMIKKAKGEAIFVEADVSKATDVGKDDQEDCGYLWANRYPV